MNLFFSGKSEFESVILVMALKRDHIFKEYFYEIKNNKFDLERKYLTNAQEIILGYQIIFHSFKEGKIIVVRS
jgi:hypothetical protein